MILEYPIIVRRTGNCAILIFPKTLQVPHLVCHLALVASGFALSIGSLLLNNCCGLHHALSLHCPPIRLLPYKYSSLMAFIHAPSKDARDWLYLRCPQP